MDQNEKQHGRERVGWTQQGDGLSPGTLSKRRLHVCLLPQLEKSHVWSTAYKYYCAYYDLVLMLGWKHKTVLCFTQKDHFPNSKWRKGKQTQWTMSKMLDCTLAYKTFTQGRIYETFSTQFVGKKFTDSWRALGKNLLKFPPRATISFQKLIFFWERVAALSLRLWEPNHRILQYVCTVSPKSTTATYTLETPASNYMHKI